ncbi:MAG: RraA family protein [Candidatus Bathyarchaeia archaeon]
MGLEKNFLQKILEIPTASLSDALDGMGIRGFMDYSIKPRTCDVKVVGTAVTVKDRLSARKVAPIKALEAVENAPKGAVLVRSIEGVGEDEASNIALFGGIMAYASKARGLSGAVLDGGFRDLAECKMLEFPVFSRSVVPTNSVGRTEVVDVNVPIFCGGIRVNPGDIIVGDLDGVVVIPQERLKEVVEQASKIEETEKKIAAELPKSSSILSVIKKYSRL